LVFDGQGASVTVGGEPKEVEALRSTLRRLPGVTAVAVTFHRLVGFDVSDLGLVTYGDFPAAALRRSNGGLADESLIQVEVRLDRSDEAWNSLEFLAWVVRDSARSGDNSQMRVRGLPPQVANQVQIGTTLTFLLEWFVVHPSGDFALLLTRVCDETKHFSETLNLYGHLVGARST
jgi:hypothetical protein